MPNSRWWHEQLQDAQGQHGAPIAMRPASLSWMARVTPRGACAMNPRLRIPATCSATAFVELTSSATQSSRTVGLRPWVEL